MKLRVTASTPGPPSPHVPLAMYSSTSRIRAPTNVSLRNTDELHAGQIYRVARHNRVPQNAREKVVREDLNDCLPFRQPVTGNKSLTVHPRFEIFLRPSGPSFTVHPKEYGRTRTHQPEPPAHADSGSAPNSDPPAGGPSGRESVGHAPRDSQVAVTILNLFTDH